MPKPITVGEVEDRFACFMRMHRRAMMGYFQSIGMFNGHPHILFHVRRTPGLTQNELAACMHVSPASIAISIRRFEDAGLVERRRDEQDGRVMHLYLTPAGEKMDAACAKGRDFMTETLYQGFTQGECEALYALLGKMIDNMQAACETMPAGDSAGKEDVT